VDPAVIAVPDTTGHAVVVVADTGNPTSNAQNLQTAVNNASCNPNGTVIRLPAGVTYSVPGAPITLPAKSCAAGQWIVIRTDAPDAALPPPGTRIDLSFAPVLPRLVTTFNNVGVFQAGINVRNYRLLGLLVTMTADVNGSLIAFGDGRGGGPQDTVAEVPTNLVVDRCLVRGSDTPPRNLGRGVEIHCGQCAVLDSWIDQAHQVGFDSQAIAGWNGTGPVLIRNNYLEGAAENILIGGASSSIFNVNPSDITIERNYLFKPYTWRVGHPTYAGTRWTVKNLLELKTGVRVLIEGNVLENCWADAQVCAAFNIKSSNSGGNLWAQTADVTIRYNHILRAEGGAAQISGWNGIYPSQFLQRVSFHDNLFERISGATYGGRPGGNYFIAGGRAGAIRLEHNTMIMVPPHPGQSYVFDSDVSSPDLPFPEGIVFHDNIFGASGQAKESCSLNGRPPQAWHCFDSPPGAGNGEDAWHRNLVYNTSGPGLCTGGRPLSTGSPWAKNKAACVKSISDVGFVDSSKGNYRLAPGSPGKGRATDGRDVGADMDLVEQKTRGVR
jgi:hypothetical protein